jgi:hypothetical protein
MERTKENVTALPRIFPFFYWSQSSFKFFFFFSMAVCLTGCTGKKVDSYSSTPSVYTFANGEHRPGFIESRIGDISKLKISALRSDQYKDALKIMPLYIRGNDLSLPTFKEKRLLLFGTKKNTIKLIDIDSDQIVWEKKIPHGMKLEATPYIDIEEARIFFHAQKRPRKPPGHRIKGIFQMSFENPKIQGFTFTLKNWIGETEKDLINCKTALSLNKVSHPNYLFWGCAVPALTRVGGKKYGTHQGIRGGLLTVPLKSNGDLNDLREFHFFPTSKIISDVPVSGLDSGVYNIGSGPSLYKDGSILLATGNGPVDFDREQFGCSVLRLKGWPPKIMKSKDGKKLVFTIDRSSHFPCWALNIEYSNSAVSLVQNQKKAIGAILSKDGHLTVFSPDNMHRSRTDLKIGATPSYGQPITFLNKNQINIFAVANSAHPSPRPYEQDIFTTKEYVPNIPSIKSYRCVGLIKSSKTGKKQLSLLYSGRTRNHYTNAISPSNFLQELTSTYSKVFGTQKKDSLNKLNPMYRVLAVLGGLPEELESKQFQKTTIKLEFDSLYPSRPSHFSLPVLIRKVTEQSECQTPPSGWVALFKAKLSRVPEPSSQKLTAYSYKVLPSANLKKKWEFSSSELLATRSSPLAIIDQKNKTSILILTAVQKTPFPKYFVLFLNGDTGKLIRKLPLPAKVHYSMPLAFDEYVFIPTIKGIQKYQLITQKSQ